MLMRRIEDSVIAITGGGRGIGAAAAELLAEAGGRVYICSRTRTQLDAVAGSQSAVSATTVDIRDEGAVDRWMGTIEDEAGRLDVLVNNASILGPKRHLDETEVDDWRRTIDINVNGTFVVTRRAYPLLRASETPLVINLSSSVGRKGRGGWGAYSVSKFAVEGLAEVAADELAGQRGCVVTLNPGGTATEMRAEAYPDEDPTTLPSPAKVGATIRLLAERLGPKQNGNKYSSRALFDAVDGPPNAALPAD